MQTEIVIRNPRVTAFYASHPHIDPEKVNVVFVDLMEKVLDGVSPSMGETALAEIMRNVGSLTAKVAALTDGLAAVPADAGDVVARKFAECRAAYVDELRAALAANVGERIEALVDRGNAAMHDKLCAGNDVVCARVRDMVRDAAEANAREAREAAKSGGGGEAALLAAVETNFAKVHAALTAAASDRDGRVSARLDEIRDAAAAGTATSTQVCASLADLLKKMENSSTKGKISETILYNTLVAIFPSAHVDHVAGMKESGDVIVRRKRREPVLVENKCYDRNVSQDEINKFYRDIDAQDMSGIFISQRTGIVGKANFEIEVRGENVVVFMHRVEYDADKIKAAFDILDHFHSKMQAIAFDAGDAAMRIDVDRSVMDSVNQEYRDFILVRLNHIRSIKEYATKMVAQTEAMRLPNLDALIIKHYSPTNGDSEMMCEFCSFAAKNPKALAAHLRACISRKTAAAVAAAVPLQPAVPK
jgi:hypothetical protein